ncbi:MAG TPA: hypothetical protein VFA46_20365 [Actinomycetes bacterium]|jgi:hypothetical protein|nr:hypothetical protein [Actinomycetes bacterium]
MSRSAAVDRAAGPSAQGQSEPDPDSTRRAADLPATILADLLGMHVHTAVRWVTYARRDWADYLAARAADTGNPGRDG